MIDQLVQSKLVLLGEMGSGKTSLVQRFVRGQYYENQVRLNGQGSVGARTQRVAPSSGRRWPPPAPSAGRRRCKLHSAVCPSAGIHHWCIFFHKSNSREACQV